MSLRFATTQAWEQAQMLLQPAYIRLIDHLRKQLETSDWQGQDLPLWPQGTTEDEKSTVLQLQRQLFKASPDESAAIEAQLADLPAPHPGYVLTSPQGDRQLELDLWQLQFKVCFQDYDLDDEQSDRLVTIDPQLIDPEGEIDWQGLDTKAGWVIEQIFTGLG